MDKLTPTTVTSGSASEQVVTGIVGAFEIHTLNPHTVDRLTVSTNWNFIGALVVSMVVLLVVSLADPLVPDHSR